MNTVSIVLADTGAKGGWQAAAKQYALGWLIGAGGYTIILIAYYAILKTTHYPPFFLPYPPFAAGRPNSLVFSMKTICLVPTFTLLSAVNTALFRKTKISVSVGLPQRFWPQ